MRAAGIALATLSMLSQPVLARVSDMVCRATSSVQGHVAAPGAIASAPATDTFRVRSGRLFHAWSGREEYLYNDILEDEPGRYRSGHMLFVLNSAAPIKGYVVIAGPADWRVLGVVCEG